MKENKLITVFVVAAVALLAYWFYSYIKTQRECESKGAAYFRGTCLHHGLP